MPLDNIGLFRKVSDEMKKNILLIAMLLLMTGCYADANFTIDNKHVTEEYTIFAKYSDYDEVKKSATYPLPLYYDTDIEDPYSSNPKKQSGIKYYESNVDDNNMKATVKGVFSLKKHVKSSVVRNCFKFYNITTGDNNDILTFSTSEGLTCDFSNFNINVKTPYKVIYNNADLIDQNNNIYTWKINNNNRASIAISLTIDFSQKYNEENNTEENTYPPSSHNKKEQKKNNVVLYSIIIGIVILLLIFILFLLNKKKNVSEI